MTGPIINNNISTSPPTVNTTSEQVSEYYCTSNGCGYYESGICLDCDTDNNKIPDETYDPRDPTMEGCVMIQHENAEIQPLVFPLVNLCINFYS